MALKPSVRTTILYAAICVSLLSIPAASEPTIIGDPNGEDIVTVRGVEATKSKQAVPVRGMGTPLSATSGSHMCLGEPHRRAPLSLQLFIVILKELKWPGWCHSCVTASLSTWRFDWLNEKSYTE